MVTDGARKKTGRRGEDEACAYLVEIGHTILSRNWRKGHLELDIVSVDNIGIHFVEVKTRRLPMQGEPEESVDGTKRRNVTNAALRYLSSEEGECFYEKECFFDIVTVVFEGENVTVEYYPQAFIPVYYGK